MGRALVWLAICQSDNEAYHRLVLHGVYNSIL